MEERLLSHHETVTKWMNDFQDKCQEHFIWLDEVLQVAAENYQKRDVEVLPKTPSAKRKTRKRKPTVPLSSEDDDFVDPPSLKPKQSGRSTLTSSGPSGDTTGSSLESTDDDLTSASSTRSTRSSKPASSSRSTRSQRGKKKVKYDDGENDPSSHVLANELQLNEDVEERCNPAAKLFGNENHPLPKIIEETENEAPSDIPVVSNDKVINEEKEEIEEVQVAISASVQKTPKNNMEKLPVRNSAKKRILGLNTSLQNLKNTLTPSSPRVLLERMKNGEDDSNVAESVPISCSNVKDKVRAYDTMVSHLSPVMNRSVTTSPCTKGAAAEHYTSILNVTLSSERLPGKTRIIRQISHSPHVKRLSMKRKSSIKSRRSSVVSRKSSVASQRSSLNARRSERLRKQVDGLSLPKRKSGLRSSHVSIVLENHTPEVVVCSPVTAKSGSTPAQNPTSSTCKRQLGTDSDSSGTPTFNEKRVKADQVPKSPHVKRLQAADSKSSDSEYVTDDSDVPQTPPANKNKYRTPPRTKTLVSQKLTQSRSPLLSGSFIKRNTPKALTMKERQEIFKKELSQKRQQEERHLEKLRLQKQQELERQKRKREERHQQVLAKRLAQQKAANEQSMSSVRLKAKRGSAVIREQRERAEQERQKRLRKQAEAEERRRVEEEKRLQKLREKEEDARMVQAMMQRKKEFEEQERQRRLAEERRLADQKRAAEEKRLEMEQKETKVVNTTLNSSQLHKTANKQELQSYNIDDIRSDDETDDEDAPKKEIPPWAQGSRMKACMIQQHYKKIDVDAIFPPSVLLVAPDLNLIFPRKYRPRFDKRTSSAVWSPIHKHFQSMS